MLLESSLVRLSTRILSVEMFLTLSCLPRRPRLKSVLPPLRPVMFQDVLDARTKLFVF
jgi:hypothetical protein